MASIQGSEWVFARKHQITSSILTKDEKGDSNNTQNL